MNGTSVPQTIAELSRHKTVTVFTDGDRGGDLIIKELLNVAEIDFVTKAPDGKEVEEITKKEIHKCLRSKISAEQASLELPQNIDRLKSSRPNFSRPPQRTNFKKIEPRRNAITLTLEEKTRFRSMVEDLVGTRGGYILDGSLNILGKVPITELAPTIKSLNTGIHAIVFDGRIDDALLDAAEQANIRHLIGRDTNVRRSSSVNLMTTAEL